MSGFFNVLGSNIAQSAGNQITQSMFGIGKNEKQEQFENELYKMGLQFQYNRSMALANNQLSKDYWNYTNFENQVRHLKAAGLNPALMYAKGGQGGSTTAGTGQGIQMGQSEAIMMGLQAKNIEAQSRLANAEAMKAEEEAKTKENERNKMDSETSLNEAMKKLTKTRDQLTSTQNEREKIGIGIDKESLELQKKMNEQAKQTLKILTIDADIKEETKQATIDKLVDESYLPYYQRLLYGAQIRNMEAATEKEKALKEQIVKSTSYIAYHFKSERMMAEAAKEGAAAQTTHSEAYQQSIDQEAERIQGQLARWAKENGFTDAQIAQIWSSETRQWIHGTIELGVDLLGMISPKKFFQMVTKDTWVKGKGQTKQEVTTYDQWEKRTWPDMLK